MHTKISQLTCAGDNEAEGRAVRGFRVLGGSTLNPEHLLALRISCKASPLTLCAICYT